MSRQQRPFGSHVHTFNYFVISCPILMSFSFLSFGNKFSLKITKPALELISSQIKKKKQFLNIALPRILIERLMTIDRKKMKISAVSDFYDVLSKGRS